MPQVRSVMSEKISQLRSIGTSRRTTISSGMRQLKRSMHWALIAAWLILILALLFVWGRGLVRPATVYAVTADRQSVAAFESRAGQLTFLYIHLPGRVVDTSRTVFRPAGYQDDVAFLEWDSPATDRFHRSAPIPLINTEGYYDGDYPPWGADDLYVSLPFGHGFVKLALGPATVSGRGSIRDRVTWVQLILPNWLVFIVIGLPGVFLVRPAFRWLNRQWRSRFRPGYCPVCGYDLRATSQRCPECGHEIAALKA